MNSYQYENGRVTTSWSEIKRVAKLSGLRSKKSRKVMKRFKKMLNKALVDWLDNHA